MKTSVLGQRPSDSEHATSKCDGHFVPNTIVLSLISSPWHPSLFPTAGDHIGLVQLLEDGPPRFRGHLPTEIRRSLRRASYPLQYIQVQASLSRPTVRLCGRPAQPEQRRRGHHRPPLHARSADAGIALGWRSREWTARTLHACGRRELTPFGSARRSLGGVVFNHGTRCPMTHSGQVTLAAITRPAWSVMGVVEGMGEGGGATQRRSPSLQYGLHFCSKLYTELARLSLCTHLSDYFPHWLLRREPPAARGS